MTSAPTIATDRLVLRPVGMGDHAAYVAFVTSDRARYMGGPHEPETGWEWLTNDVAHWELLGFGGLAVMRGDVHVGQVSVTQGVEFPEPELGWFLFDGHERKGYAREAAAALKSWVVAQRRVETLVSYIDRANVASMRLASVLGAVRDDAAARPEGSDCLVYRHEVAA